MLAEPGAWKMLLRSLRAGSLEIVPAEFTSPFGAPFLKPDPIPINVKVVLIGDGGLYEVLSGPIPISASSSRCWPISRPPSRATGPGCATTPG